MDRALDRLQLSAFAILGISTIVSILIAFKTEAYYIALVPFALLIIYQALINFKSLYFLLLFAIPVSFEYNFSPSLGTDLPDEPLMIGLMFVTIVFILTNYKLLPTGYFGNILMIALITHLFWIFITSLNSNNEIVSFKIFLAKVWYVITFGILTAIVIKTKEDIKKMFWCIYIPLTLLLIQVLIRHAFKGFSFDEVNGAMFPFFRNHVNYAAILCVFFPFILLIRTWYEKGTSTRRLLNFSILLYLVAIYFSYTRTCYLAVLLIYPFYFIIRHKLMKPFLVLAAVGIMVFVINIFDHNNYLKYAPTFSETIYHDQLGEHLSSTFEGKDVSSMERVYRWVAAIRMFEDHPWMGFGPGNFYPDYKRYTLSSFETYVSDNPERSTAHNYPILLLTEQGVIGLAIFIFLTVTIFIYGEKVYHRIKDGENKKIYLTFLLVIAMVYVNLFLSDLLESDKVGPFFFICLSILVALDIGNRSLKTESK